MWITWITLYGTKREGSEKKTTHEYNPRLKALTFSDKDNVTGISVLNLVKMPLPTCSNCHEYARCVDDKCVCLDGYVGNGKVCEGIYES